MSDGIARLWRWYLDLWRRIVPDRLYKFWLKTGQMDPETYQEWQRRGLIQDDTDPATLRSLSPDNNQPKGEGVIERVAHQRAG